MDKSFKMIRLDLAVLLVIACLSGCGDGGESQESAVSESAVTEAQIASARQTVQIFGSELKKALLAALGEGGAEQAITACRDLAPEIASGMVARTGWESRRTSLKPRNSENTPDVWEKRILEQFETSRARGEDPSSLESYEIVDEEGQQVLRYMKAIPTGKLCLQCHGNEISPETAARIADLYPADQATGFAEGDIRGAFSLRRAL